MCDKHLTEAEVVMALVRCSSQNHNACVGCPYIDLPRQECTEVNAADVVRIISRYRKENQRLHIDLGKTVENAVKIVVLTSKIKAKVINEFAERLLSLYSNCTLTDTICMDALGCDIKRLVKEMVGDSG